MYELGLLIIVISTSLPGRVSLVDTSSSIYESSAQINLIILKKMFVYKSFDLKNLQNSVNHHQDRFPVNQK